VISLFKRSRQVIGLDIGSGFVKAAAVEHSGDEPRVIGLASLPLHPDALVDGEIMDPCGVAEVVRDVIEMLPIRSRWIVASVGGRDVIVKKIQLPRMPTTDVREVIRFEAEQYVLVEMDNVQIDFQILDPEGESEQMSVLLVAAKRDLVQQRISLISDAGHSAAVVDVDAFALFNALEFNYPAVASTRAALVNVGHESTTIVVHQGGVPVVAGEVAFGTRHLRHDLLRTHGISTDAAESLLQGRSSPDGEVERRCYHRSSELAAAIDRAAAFPSIHGAMGQGLGAVHLSGGGARVPRLQEAIADHLRVRVEVANPFQRLEVSPDAGGDLPAESAAPMWMLAIGLALRSPV
jgi:type IV pilus assembly protein PilM